MTKTNAWADTPNILTPNIHYRIQDNRLAAELACGEGISRQRIWGVTVRQWSSAKGEWETVIAFSKLFSQWKDPLDWDKRYGRNYDEALKYLLSLPITGIAKT
jgi:hypothetical protein